MEKATGKSTELMEDCVVVFITTPSAESAERISRELLDERLTACANIIHSVRSLFHWEGKIDDENEWLLICKTRKTLIGRLTDFVRKRHEYKVPEIIALPIIGGNRDYLKWVKESTVE